MTFDFEKHETDISLILKQSLFDFIRENPKHWEFMKSIDLNDGFCMWRFALPVNYAMENVKKFINENSKC